MKKRFLSLFAALLFLPLLSFSVSAEELIPQIEEFAGTEAIYDAVSKEDGEAAKRLLSDTSPTSLLSFLWEALLPGVQRTVPFFLHLVAMILVATLIRAGTASFGGKTVGGAMELILATVFFLSTYPSLAEGIELCGDSLSGLTGVMTAGLPAMATLSTMAGNVSSATLQATSLSFFVTGAGAIYSSVLFPAVRALFALFCAGTIGRGSVSPLFRFGKKAVKRAVVLGFTLLAAMLGLRNALALSQDTLAMRSVRFAAGNFIPVVGPLVGENARALAAALGAVKTHCGIAVILLILLLCLPCIISLWCKKAALSLAAAVAEMLGEDRFSGMLEGLGELFDLLLALAVAQGVFFIFYVALFLKGGGIG